MNPFSNWQDDPQDRRRGEPAPPYPGHDAAYMNPAFHPQAPYPAAQPGYGPGYPSYPPGQPPAAAFESASMLDAWGREGPQSNPPSGPHQAREDHELSLLQGAAPLGRLDGDAHYQNNVGATGGLGTAPSEKHHPKAFQGARKSDKAKPNWKPFYMRWPYLTLLILISFVSASAVEFLRRQSEDDPLLEFETPDQINPGNYFAFKYGPAIVGVLYGILWQFTDIEIKRLEAFYQLSRDQGSASADSINVDYITSVQGKRPLIAIRKRQYVVFVSSLATLIAVSLVPTAMAGMMVMKPDREERIENPEGTKQIVVDGVAPIVLIVIFILCGVLGIVILCILQCRRSGLLSDIKGIAGIASLAAASHVLDDFSGMDVADDEKMHRKLNKRRYHLCNAALLPDEKNISITEEEDDQEEGENSNLDGSNQAAMMPARKHPHPHTSPLRSTGYGIFAAVVVILLALIPVFLFTPARVITEEAPSAVTLTAVFIKLNWWLLDADMRMLEPYYILSQRHAPASILTVDYTAVPLLVMPIKAYRNRHYLLSLVGFGAVMSEILTVFVTSLTTVQGTEFLDLAVKKIEGNEDQADKDEINAGQDSAAAFWFCLSVTVVILVYLLVVATAVYVKRRRPFVPRRPNTISSVLAYIHQSRMVEDFVGTSRMSEKEMARHLLTVGKRYGFGWFTGRDGLIHCGVEQEELLGSYEHGQQQFGGGNKPWDVAYEPYRRQT